MHIHELQTAHSASEIIVDTIQLSESLTSFARRYRSRSFDQTAAARNRSFLDRLKHTYELKLKGFKGNIRGEHIQAPFTTLEEMLRNLPESLGIDIELSKNDPHSIPSSKD
jgi:hypothetical protein